jgi:MFS transporter, DHA1 family, inner membrane transport protein
LALTGQTQNFLRAQVFSQTIMNTKERLLLLVLASVNFTHIMDFMIMMPLGPALMEKFGASPSEFGFAVSSYSLTAGITGFISAFFVDRFDRKRVLLFAYIGFVIGTLACAVAPSFELLIAARILAGFFGGMIGSQVLSIVGDTFEYERRGLAMGVLMTAFSAASVAGVPTGLWLASRFTWHTPFWVIGGLGVLITGLIIAFVPNMTRHIEQGGAPKNPLNVLKEVVATSNQRLALALSAVAMIGHFSIIPYITPYLVNNTGYQQDQIFLIYLVGGAFTIVSSPLVGRLADRRGKQFVFTIFALLSIVPILLITNMWAAPLWIILGAAALFFVAANGRVIPMQALVSSVVPPQQRGAFMSVNSSLQQLASGLAANLGGAIIVNGQDGRLLHYNWVGFMCIFFVVMAVLLAGRVKAIG